MKVATILKALGFGYLLCGCYASNGQPQIYSTPIVVQLADVDRDHLYVHVRHEPVKFPDGHISLFFNELRKSKVHELVKFGMISHSPVWVMDGKKLLVQCSLAGQAEFGGSDGKSEYGFLLRFSSREDAEKAGAILKLRSDSNEANSKSKK